MTIPNIPTDNLYKFLSIGGIIILIAGIYLLVLTDNGFNEKLDLHLRNRSILTIDSAYLIHDKQIIDNKIKKLCEKCDCKCNSKNDSLWIIPTPSDPKYLPQRAEIDNLIEDYFKKQKEISIKEHELEIEAKRVIYYQEAQSFYLNALSLFSVLGLFISITGFSLWFNKVQKFQDMALVGEAEKYNGALSKELEEIKGQLEKERLEHQVKFSKIHEERAVVIKEMYKRIVKIHYDAQIYFVNRDRKEIGDHPSSYLFDTLRYFEDHELLFSDKVNSLISETIGHYTQLATNVDGLSVASKSIQDSKYQEEKYWYDKIYDSLQKKIPELKKELKEEFRNLI
jgi:hypothetical protein